MGISSNLPVTYIRTPLWVSSLLKLPTLPVYFYYYYYYCVLLRGFIIIILIITIIILRLRRSPSKLKFKMMKLVLVSLLCLVCWVQAAPRASTQAPKISEEKPENHGHLDCDTASKGNGNGWMVERRNCAIHWWCKDGHADGETKECPLGKWFNIKKGGCDSPDMLGHQSQCQGRKAAADAGKKDDEDDLDEAEEEEEAKPMPAEGDKEEEDSVKDTPEVERQGRCVNREGRMYCDGDNDYYVYVEGRNLFGK